MNRSGKCEGPGGGDRRGALCTGFTLVLRKEVEVRKNLHNWHKQVHYALWVYNSTFKLSIGFTSFCLAYGVESTLPIEYKVMTFHTTKQHRLGIETKDCWNWWNWEKANCEHNKLSN